jgi:hypothetical protein
MDTATFWPDWISRLDRVVIDSCRLLGSMPERAVTRVRVFEDMKLRLISLTGQLKVLNRNVIGGDARGATKLVHDVETALESAVQLIETTILESRGDPDGVSTDGHLNLISAALGDVEHRATLLVLPLGSA